MAGGKRRKYDDIHMTPDVSYITNPDVAHEESDESVGPIAKFVLGLFIFSVVICVLMYVMFLFFERRAVESERRPSPLARRGEAALPPHPRLQASKGFVLDDSQDPSDVLTPQQQDFQLREPQAEYRELSKIWDGMLAGQPDPRTGQAGMPIDEAMKRVVEDGSLRTRAPAANQEQLDIKGADVPSFQSSGRMPEKRDQ